MLQNEASRSHAEKIVTRIIRRTVERIWFGFRRGNKSRCATGMLKIISERNLEIVEKLCA